MKQKNHCQTILALLVIMLVVFVSYSCGSSANPIAPTPTKIPTIAPTSTTTPTATPSVQDLVSQLQPVQRQDFCPMFNATWAPGGDTIAINRISAIRLLNIETMETTLIGEDMIREKEDCELGLADALLSMLSGIVWLPNGNTIAISTFDTVDFWDVGQGQKTFEIKGNTLKNHIPAYGDSTLNDLIFLGLLFKESIQQFTISPDGSRLVFAQEKPNTLTGYATELYIWDIAEQEKLLILSGHDNRVNSVAYSPDGSQIASADDDGIILIWDSSNGALLGQFDGHIESMSINLAWSPDGKTIASGGSDEVIRVWDVQTGETLGTLEGHTSGIIDLAWSPLAPLLVSAGGNGDETIKFWDMEDLVEIHNIDVFASNLEWSPDGRYLLSSDSSSLTVWGFQN
ncbi:MAG: WD40 repeat domain-containing protein [Anaerolineaceae bacterium]|nr:WD40 repeat domain-containing protein [Anaerolineaceae bacterium]